jgi:ribonucleoside-diphosphate reductase alpha chain
VNLEYFDEWRKDEKFLEDIHRYTDNILQSFIDLTANHKGFSKARKGAIDERSIGIGTMGYHSYLQSHNMPYNGLSTRYITDMMFKHINSNLELSNMRLGVEKGPAPLSDVNRNINVTAIAPTASISTLCNLASPGIDPRISNVYTAKTNIGSYTIKNKFLDDLIREYEAEYERYVGDFYEDAWKSITKNQGSVQQLVWMRDEDKEVYKTAYEINPMSVIENVSIMQKYITQGISTNLFLPADVNVQTLYNVHVAAWKKNLKSLYYVRSTALNRANIGNVERQDIALEADTCLSCS